METVSTSSSLEKFSIEGVNRNEIVAKETAGVDWIFFFKKKANIGAYLYGNWNDPTKMKRSMI